MHNGDPSRRRSSVPPIVHIVITQATRRRAGGDISDAVFEKQMWRLIHEELEPRGLKLLVRNLPGGRTRFIIKEQATGTVCDMMNFDSEGTLEPDSSELLARTASN